VLRPHHRPHSPGAIVRSAFSETPIYMLIPYCIRQEKQVNGKMWGGMRACSLGLVGFKVRLGLVLGIGLVSGLAMALGVAHFTFCHASSPHRPQARILPIARKVWYG